MLMVSKILSHDEPPKQYHIKHAYVLPDPFASPIKYLGMSKMVAADIIGVQPNKVGNIILEKQVGRLLAHVGEDDLVSYVDIEFNNMGKCAQNEKFDPKPFLLALDIDPEILELARSQTHYHTYWHHEKRLKIAVSCLSDGSPYNVYIGSKYYLE